MISQYGHSVWTVQDGYLPGAPMEMAQTTDGYLWIGTRGGLVRFDGVRFVPFRASDGGTLRSNRIISLRAGRDGSLWIGTRPGLHRYKDGKLFFFADAPGWAVSIAEDAQGKIWFTRSSLSDDKGPLCEVRGDSAVCHAAANGVPIQNARQLSLDAQGNSWTVSDNTLMRWKDGVSRTWLPPGLPDPEQNTIDVLQSVVPAADGSVWVGATQPSRGLGLLHLKDDKLQAFVAPGMDGRKMAVSLVYVDKRNALWVGTQDEGIYRYHDGRVSRFRAQDGLTGDTLQGFFEDREGTFWVLTTRGLEAFRELPVVSVSSREGLSADLANGVIARRDGSVWINAWHSIDELRDGKITSLDATNGLPGQEATAMFEDRAGNFWVGIDQGLTIYERGKFTPVRRPDGSSFGIARGLVEVADGDIWSISARPFTLTRIRQRKVVEEIPRETVPVDRSIAADPTGGIWLGLRNGDLGRYYQGQLQTIPFNREPATGAVSGLVVYPDGAVIGGTPLGLIAWREGRARTMTAAANGLPCDEVNTLLLDDASTLWLYASCGIVVIPAEQVEAWWKDPAARVSYRLFDALDGAQPTYGNFFPKSSIGPDGRLWFANASVVQVVDPRAIGGNKVPPPVHIEQVLADRQSFPVQAGLRLPPKLGNLQIDYTGLSFTVPRKTQFRYRLAGHDTEWLDVGTRRQAFYTDLPPGDYVFEVTASNNDGVWNEQGARLPFSIEPAYYQTRTFLVVCVLAGLAALWLAYLLRVRQIEMRMRLRMEERVAERERIARELHDTLLQGMLSASLQLSVANSQIPPEAPAKSLLERIQQLLRQAIDEGRNAVRDLRTRGPSEPALERALAQLPEDLAMDKQVDFRLRVEGASRELRPAIRDEVYRIAREALANAFRHSEASSVEVVLEYSADRFRLWIRDDGRGMDPDVLQSGREGHWGLSGMRERSNKIGAEFKVMSARGAGTEVELGIPASAAFEAPGSRT